MSDQSPVAVPGPASEPICPGCKRPVSECRAEDVDDPVFPGPASVSPADTPCPECRGGDGHSLECETGRREIQARCYPVVSPADTLAALLAESRARGNDLITVTPEWAAALLAVGERDKAEIEALTAAVDGLLDVGTRSRSGDPSVVEEWYAIRDYAQKVLKDGDTATALRESRERDRRQIARLTEALKRIAYGNVEQRGSLQVSFADASNFARAVLADEEDAGNG